MATKTALRALTIRQPWASLIVSGIKDIENRSWSTKHRGLLLIHAGQGIDPSDWNRHVHAEHHAAIIGAVTLSQCIRDADSEWAEQDSWHWRLIDPIEFDQPIPVKGKLGLWTPTEDIIDRCRRELVYARDLTMSEA